MLDMLVGDICYRISTLYCTETLPKTPFPLFPSAAAAAKSLQSCPTLCNPIDGSPPGSPVPGILQARTLEGVAISFSNAWKWKVKVKSLSRVRLLATPWTGAHQAPPTTGFSRQEYWSGLPLPSPTEAKLFCSQARSNLPNSLPHLNLYGLPVLSPSLFSVMQINLSGFCFFFLTFDWYLNSSLYREFRN